jgi:CheY-like chemotaxis protein
MNDREREQALDHVPEVHGSETVLLVEEDAQDRAVVRDILRQNGYVVLEAASPGDAILLCERQEGRIHLLITDVVMADMSGPELALRLAASRPEMRIVFVSATIDASRSHHGILDAGVAFVEKPITPESFSRKVREVLGARP